jgi:peptidoglycan/xylan/chitin deacetylase (PgdA/CDA1 family)
MICILMYHTFGAPPTPGSDPRYCLPGEAFRRHLAAVIHSGSAVVSPGDYLREQAAGASRPSVAITIDDGDATIHSIALPALREAKLSATVYLVTGSIGAPGFLTREQIRECRREGISFQSHTHTHRLLHTLSPHEICDELTRSREVLEELLGEPVEGLALPGGAGDLALVGRMAREIGYQYVATSEWGYNRRVAESFLLERISYIAGMDDHRISRFIAGDELLVRRMRMRKRALELLRYSVGEGAYNRIREYFG